ncbi:MAG: class I mannose-6-phosphate isomerase, partial [Clostridia bacterium]|nr:class I mannose-6-phosphate isomerase [Clostridia bacterium]
LVLEYNRVERFYTGGSAIDEWQKFDNPVDSNMSEELLVNTNEYIGPGKPFDHGYSQTVINGTRISLKSLIDNHTKALLGEKYEHISNLQSGVLCKVGDSTGRLILQYHPTKEFAEKELHSFYGKTEAWYILKTRDDGPHFCYAGFKKHVTRELFFNLFINNDVPGMLECIHRVYFNKGDMILIKAGMIHAMGAGATFLEIHEPCDYTFRFERDNYGRHMEDNDLHYGLGNEKLFDGLSFSTFTEEEIRKQIVIPRKTISSINHCTQYEILGYDQCAEFKADIIDIRGSYFVPDFDGHYIIVAVEGDVELVSGESNKTLIQGKAAFIPAAVKSLIVRGKQSQILITYPFRIEERNF